MKRLIKLVLIALAAIIPAGNTTAQRVLNLDSNSISKESIGEDVTRTIKPVEDGYIVTYLFHKVLLDSDDYQQDCEIPIMTGFVTNNINGEPAYPYADDSFSVPSGQGASFQILEEEWVEFNSKPAPAKGPETMLAMDDSHVNNIVPIKSFSGWFPLETVCENSLKSYKGVSIYSLGIKPVKYNLETGKAKICRKLQYKVSFSPINSLYNRSVSRNSSSTSTEDNNFLSNITLNWREEHGYDMGSNKIVGGPNSGSMLQSPGYLIIAPSEFKSSADGFADWKRTLGNNVIVSCSDNWTNEAVTDSIIKIHNKTPLTYLLILGNHKKVPAHSFKMALEVYDDNSKLERDVLTDLNYALSTKEMNSDDDIIPELQYGRIPANSDTEVYNALEKIRYYESRTNGSEEFFNSNLFISAFEPGYGKTTERLRNCQTTYEISQYVKDLGRVPTLALYSRPDVDPLKWSQATLNRLPNGNTVISTDRNIPTDMQRPNYGWDADIEDISNGINKGVSQVFYFAHGEWDEWKLPNFTIENIRNLNNSDHNLPVIFSMACNTGSFLSNTCFSQEFLTKEYGGAVAVFGFTGTTFAGYTDVASASFFNGMWPKPGLCPLISWDGAKSQLSPDINTSITSLGMLANYARLKMISTFPESSSNQNKIHNYYLYEAAGLSLFGDPSMNIFLKKPIKIKCSISCPDRKNVQISAPENAMITVFNSKTKDVRNYKGNTTNIELPADRCPYIICIHSPETLPVIYNVGVSKCVSKKDNNYLQEDWVWKYYQEFNSDYSDPFDTSCENKCSDIYVNVGFSGTTVIDGMEYKNCTIWRDGEKPADGDAPVIAYLREEGNKIYMRDVKLEKGLYKTLFEDYGISLNPYICPSFRWAHNNKPDSERLIYDFDLDKGDTLWFDNECRDDKAGLQVIGRYTSTVDGEKIDIQEYQIYDYEIGVVYCGLGAADSLLPFPCAYSDMPFTPFRLIAIHDKENNPVITMPEGGFPPSPDETGITSVNQFINSSYYDMQGRQVSKPAEGIFIRVDRMQDGSVVSRKVCMQAR